MPNYISGLGGESTIFLTPPLLDNYKVEFVPTGTFVSFPSTKVAGYTYPIVSCRKVSASFMFTNRQEFKDFRDFYTNRKGQLYRFWLPCWKTEFELSRAVQLNDSAIFIKNVDLTSKDNTYLRIFMTTKVGDIIIRRATEVSYISATEERIVLDSPMPVALQPSDVVLFSRLLIVRFNSDLEVKIMKADNTEFIGTTDISFIELPHEYAEVGI
jgi:hypothetical protein